MTLVIFEIHKYVHLLKTLFSFLFFIFQLSTLRSARSDAFLRSIGAQALRGGLAKNFHLSTLRSARSDAFLRSIGARALRGGPAKNFHLICDHRWYRMQIFNFSNECKTTDLQNHTNSHRAVD